jgi:transposase InsO family protein
LPDGFRHEADLYWDPTLRALIANWSPDLITAKSLVRFLGGEGTSFEERLHLTVARLTSVCPLLASRLVRVYKDELLSLQVRAGQRTRLEVQLILRHVCCRLLELPPMADDGELVRCKEALVDTIAEVLGLGNAVHPAFVSSPAGGMVQKAVDLFEGRSIPKVHLANLSTAFATVDPLRRLVAATLVQRLIN